MGRAGWRCGYAHWAKGRWPLGGRQGGASTKRRESRTAAESELESEAGKPDGEALAQACEMMNEEGVISV